MTDTLVTGGWVVAFKTATTAIGRVSLIKHRPIGLMAAIIGPIDIGNHLGLLLYNSPYAVSVQNE